MPKTSNGSFNDDNDEERCKNGGGNVHRCHCNWKSCRSFQRAFRDSTCTGASIFHGVVKVTFEKDDMSSMRLKSAFDRILGVDERKREYWDGGKATYYVARHHFTKHFLLMMDERNDTTSGAATTRTTEDDGLFKWTEPLSLDEAETMLYQLDQEDIVTISEEESGFLKVPNVPRKHVRKIINGMKGEGEYKAKKTMASSSNRSKTSRPPRRPVSPSEKGKKQRKFQEMLEVRLQNVYNESAHSYGTTTSGHTSLDDENDSDGSFYSSSSLPPLERDLQTNGQDQAHTINRSADVGLSPRQYDLLQSDADSLYQCSIHPTASDGSELNNVDSTDGTEHAESGVVASAVRNNNLTQEKEECETSYRGRHGDLTAELQFYKTRIECLEDQLKESNSRIVQLEKENRSLSIEQARLSGLSSTRLGFVQSLEKKLNDEISAHQQREKSLRQELHDERKRTSAAMSESQKFQMQIKSLEVAMEHAKTKKQKERNSFPQTVDESKHRVASPGYPKNNNNLAPKQNSEPALLSSPTVIETSEDENENETRRVKELEAEVERLRKENVELVTPMSLQRHIESLKRARDELIKENETLRGLNGNQKKTISTMECAGEYEENEARLRERGEDELARGAVLLGNLYFVKKQFNDVAAPSSSYSYSTIHVEDNLTTKREGGKEEQQQPPQNVIQPGYLNNAMVQDILKKKQEGWWESLDRIFDYLP